MKKLLKKIGILLAAIVLATGCQEGGTASLSEQLELGQRYLEELDYESAIVAFQKAIEIDPKAMDAYVGLAEAHMALGNMEEALAAAEQGIAVFEGLEDTDKTEERTALYENLLEIAEQLREELETKAESAVEESQAIQDDSEEADEVETTAETTEASMAETETAVAETMTAPETEAVLETTAVPETTIPETLPTAVPEETVPVEASDTTENITLNPIETFSAYLTPTIEMVSGWNRIDETVNYMAGGSVQNFCAYSPDGIIVDDGYGNQKFQNASVEIHCIEFVPSESAMAMGMTYEWSVNYIMIPLTSIIGGIGSETTFYDLKVALENTGIQWEDVDFTVGEEPYIGMVYNGYYMTWGVYHDRSNLDWEAAKQFKVLKDGEIPMVLIPLA